ncbi:MAG TPA: PTS sugar transporter subunit IIA [Victivallales bacterium]|nr:PTS sugar transporter subunit IIA [Victivallales bacterium]HRU00540.1 PTS sugar transporter subunit IIA [Victivallales bacterium]
MQLSISDVAKYLNVSQRTIYRWIDKGIIPAYKINDQYRFNRAELIEWVSNKKIPTSKDLFLFPESESTEINVSVTDCLKNGGIYYRVSGRDRNSALESALSLLKLPEEVDTNLLLKMLLMREELASTGIGEGIAIPHIRNPIVLGIEKAQIALCFLENPVDFMALDGQKVFCLFLLISPNPKIHLKIISKLAFLLKSEKLRNFLKTYPSREEILKAIEKDENKLIRGKE